MILVSFCQIMYTGYTQKNGAFLIVNTIKTAPFFCVFLYFVTIDLSSVHIKLCLFAFKPNT
jgi:hypothetical protein